MVGTKPSDRPWARTSALQSLSPCAVLITFIVQLLKFRRKVSDLFLFGQVYFIKKFANGGFELVIDAGGYARGRIGNLDVRLEL